MIRSALKYLNTCLLDLLFPPSCLVCSGYLTEDILVCSSCLKELEPHKNRNKDFIAAFSYNDNIRVLVHELKYNNRPYIGNILGREMAKKLKGLIAEQNSLLLPVPLHKKRLRKRGYNQSEHICTGFAEIIDIPVEAGLLKRIKNNVSQTTMDASGRSSNVRDIFQSIPSDKDKNTMIYIIDDLITTGATTKEAVKELRRAGFLNFFALSAATSSYDGGD